MNTPNISANVTSKSSPEKPNTIFFPVSYWPLSLDYLFRWIILELRQFGYINDSIFWIFQAVILPFIFIYWVTTQAEKVNKKYKVSLPNSIAVEPTGLTLVVSLAITISGAIITFRLYDQWSDWLQWGLAIIIFCVYGFYNLVLLTQVCKQISLEDLRRQKEEFEQALISDEKEILDANDVRIVRMDIEIRSIAQRVEAYTLESTLFGALAFSGFLTLISANQNVISSTAKTITNFVDIIDQLLRQIAISESIFTVLLSWDKIGLIPIEYDLIGIITLQTLVCSMFFVSVVVARLRFYNMLRQVDYAVQIAQTFNNKEEEVYAIKLQLGQPNQIVDLRLSNISQRVKEAIEHAEPLFTDLLASSNYMGMFRSLGILTFLLILITSAFAFSITIGLAFIFIFSIASTFSFFDEWQRKRKFRKKPFFVAYNRRIFGFRFHGRR